VTYCNLYSIVLYRYPKHLLQTAATKQALLFCDEAPEGSAVAAGHFESVLKRDVDQLGIVQS
jgi:hypothetical protein